MPNQKKYHGEHGGNFVSCRRKFLKLEGTYMYEYTNLTHMHMSIWFKEYNFIKNLMMGNNVNLA